MKENELSNWLKTVPSGEIKSVRAKIMKQCKVSKFVLSFWLSGRTVVPELAKPIINEIAEKEVYTINGNGNHETEN